MAMNHRKTGHNMLVHNQNVAIHITLILICYQHLIYSKTSNISHTLVGNEIVDHSDVVKVAPISAAPTTSSFST